MKRTAVIAVSLLLAGGAPETVFAHGGDTSVIHGCVNKDTKFVRIVKATDTCKSNEVAVDWNSQGLAGPAGPTGSRGPTGPAGADGPAATLTVRRSQLPFQSQVCCLPGEKAIAGAATCAPGDALARVEYGHVCSSFTPCQSDADCPPGSTCDGSEDSCRDDIDGAVASCTNANVQNTGPSFTQVTCQAP